MTEEPKAGGIGGDPDSLPEMVWPLPDRGPSNSAYLPVGPNFDKAPAVSWEFAPIHPDEDYYSPQYLHPVIAGDTIYAVNALVYGTNVARPDKQYLRAVSADSKERWTVGISAGDSTPVPSQPAIYDEFVLLGLEQDLRAYERSTGDTAWTVGVDEDIHTIVPTSQRIIVRASRAIVAVADRTIQWTVPYEEYPSAMAISPDTVFIGSSKRISALDPATGKIRWREDLPAVSDGWGVSSLVAVPGGVLARQHSGHVYAYTTAGVEVWRTSGIDDNFATDGTFLYAGKAGSIRALRVANRETVWERTCDDISGCTGAVDVLDIAVTENSVIAALENGLVVNLDARTGSSRWIKQVPITIQGLAITDSAIYGIGDMDDPIIQFTA
jgi:outer membrane protein assembly factor BamB